MTNNNELRKVSKALYEARKRNCLLANKLSELEASSIEDIAGSIELEEAKNASDLVSDNLTDLENKI